MLLNIYNKILVKKIMNIYNIDINIYLNFGDI